MSAILKIIDKQPGQPAAPAIRLHLATERLTVRELLKQRVSDEIAVLQKKAADHARANQPDRSFLIQFDPQAVETRLNPGAKSSRPKPLNEAAEFDNACLAFQNNRFIILFDDRQIDDLDQEIIVTPTSEVVFLRLMPLVAG